MLASDDANTQFTGARNPDDILHVRFFMKPVHIPYKSTQEGKPVYEDMVFIRIETPGNNLNIIERSVEERDKQRFPRQWAAFQNLGAEAVSGTPLSEWQAITRSRAEELKYFKFFTVEQVAGCSDQQAQALGMDGISMREKARAFLQAAALNAQPQAQAAEIAELRTQLAAKEEAHKREMEELRTLILKGHEAPPKRKYTHREAKAETA